MGLELRQQVFRLARECGFARCGVAPAGEVEHSQPLLDWLGRCWHAGMKYMEANLDLRLRPDRLAPGSASVLCLAAGYATGEDGSSTGLDHIARYARGRDYHRVLKDRCRRLMDRIRQAFPRLEGRAFVDSAPVMERSLAARAGVGWIGRNGCLIVPGMGSYVLLCEIISNLPLAADEPIENRCRGCGECVGACPTGALDGSGLVDARKCISYLTIEHRDDIPREYRGRMGGWVFGCDACQAACPHNRNLPEGDVAIGGPRGAAAPCAGLSPRDIMSWSHDDWDRATRGRAVRRADRRMLIRNAVIAAGNSGEASMIGPLQSLRGAGPEFAAMTELIDWALARLRVTCG